MPQSPDIPRRTALVVDDYRDTADVLAELLEGCGFDAAIARDGGEAIQLAAQLRPELIILDIGLPTHDGLEVCTRVRQMPWAANAWIVAVTGQHLPTMRQAMTDAGFDEILAKPCTFRQIADALEHSRSNVRPQTYHHHVLDNARNKPLPKARPPV